MLKVVSFLALVQQNLVSILVQGERVVMVPVS